MDIFSFKSIKRLDLSYKNVDPKKGIERSFFSTTSKNRVILELDVNEGKKYKVVEVKSEEQNLDTNLQFLSFELLWYAIIRGVKRVVE